MVGVTSNSVGLFEEKAKTKDWLCGGETRCPPSPTPHIVTSGIALKAVVTYRCMIWPFGPCPIAWCLDR